VVELLLPFPAERPQSKVIDNVLVLFHVNISSGTILGGTIFMRAFAKLNKGWLTLCVTCAAWFVLLMVLPSAALARVRRRVGSTVKVDLLKLIR
jgi:hypothetical protein